MRLVEGIHPGVSREEYDAHPAVNHSKLRAAVRGDDRKPGRYVLIGQAVHEFLLQPDVAEGRYVTIDDVDLRTKSGREALAEIEADGKVALRMSEAAMVRNLVLAVRDFEPFQRLMKTQPDTELMVVGKLFGVECKGLLDIVGDRVIVDFKTTNLPDAQAFKDAIYKYNYDSQAAFYTDLHEDQSGELLDFAWICASKRTGEVWVHRLQPEQYVSGRRWYRDVLALTEETSR